MNSPTDDPYTPEVLAVYCSTCRAAVGERCWIFSEILGARRELREPHAARRAFAKHATRRKGPRRS